MNFELPEEVQDYLSRLDTFITDTILPVQHSNDNNRFFDHRREASRTQWNNQGLPTEDWESLLSQAKRLADKAGIYRFACPKEYGGSGKDSLNLHMCAIRYHLSSHPVYGGGVSLANDIQNEHSVVGNHPIVIMLHHYGTPQQQRDLIPAGLRGEFRATFGLTEIDHGSDATHMKTTARPITLSSGEPGYEINGNKKWQTGMHTATHCIIFARTAGKAGDANGITAFLVPRESPGLTVASYEWTLNMPTDHATVMLQNVRVPASAILGPLDEGLAIAQTFTHENRIRQAASSCGATRYCIDRSVEHANRRKVFGKPLSSNQAIQWPLVELATQEEMLRLLILRTAVEMDQVTAKAQAAGKLPWVAIEKQLGHKISMCNYYANRLVCQAADRAIQIHGGDGYSRHYPFEHIWRHFRRYRITEGSEEVQMRKVAAYLFGYKTTGLEDYDAINSAAQEHGLWVVADAAQSMGASVDGRKVGTLAQITTTSFFPSKPLGCYGDGGAVFTDDPELAQNLRSLHRHGRGHDKYDSIRVGLNSRLETLQAAVLLSKMEIFEEELDTRQLVASQYKDLLSDSTVAPLSPRHGYLLAWASYAIRYQSNRDLLRTRLNKAGIPTAVYYPKPVHNMTPYSGYPLVNGKCPVTDRAAASLISLPMHPYLDAATQERIVGVIRAV